MLKLWHLDRSPFGWKVRMVLAEKAVPYQLVIPDNKSEDPAFAKLNPLRLTPVLELPDGRTIYESTVINEYLEETYPDPPMLPKEPWERARSARVWQPSASPRPSPNTFALAKSEKEQARRVQSRRRAGRTSPPCQGQKLCRSPRQARIAT
jgi:glutathione S-transferase